MDPTLLSLIVINVCNLLVTLWTSIRSSKCRNACCSLDLDMQSKTRRDTVVSSEAPAKSGLPLTRLATMTV